MNCDCITKVNEQFRDHNTYIPTQSLLNTETGKVRLVVFIPTKPIKARGPKPLRPPMNFCPICGADWRTTVSENARL
jgi:hypothetical protein